MRIRLLILLLFLACTAGWAHAATVTANDIRDQFGHLLASGQLCFTPVKQGTGLPMAVLETGHGQRTNVQGCTPITNGAITPWMVVDTSLTNPGPNCYRAEIDDIDGTAILGSHSPTAQTGYQCVQMSSTWCSTVSGVYTCNFDNYIPTGVTGALIEAGPTGPQGPAGAGYIDGLTGDGEGDVFVDKTLSAAKVATGYGPTVMTVTPTCIVSGCSGGAGSLATITDALSNATQVQVADGVTGADCSTGGGMITHWCYCTTAASGSCSAWAPATTVGPAGPTGATGATGPAGPTGATGATGATGPAGAAASIPAFTTLTDGATVALATGGLGVTNATLTLNHSTSTRPLNVTGLASGAQFTVILKQDSTGGAALTFGTGCTWYLGTNAGFAASTTPALTAAASGINILTVLYDGTNCYANVR